MRAENEAINYAKHAGEPVGIQIRVDGRPNWAPTAS